MNDDNWNEEEDHYLVQIVKSVGNRNWKELSKCFNKKFILSKKTAKEIKSRWINHLDQSTNRNNWSFLEEYVFFEAHKILGNKWVTISRLLPGKTDNNIKNHFYSCLRKNLRMFTKQKHGYSILLINSATFKEKIKALYIMLYSRNRFIELMQYYNNITNTVNVNEEMNSNGKGFINSEELYIIEIIIHTKGQITKIDDYINELCKIVLTDEEFHNMFPPDSIINFDFKNSENMKLIENGIKEVAEKYTKLNCVNYLKKNDNCSEENREKLVNFINSSSDKVLENDLNELDFFFDEKLLEESSNNTNPNMRASPQNNKNEKVKTNKLDGEPNNEQNSEHIAEMMKIFEKAKSDPDFLNKPNPFGDPLYMINQMLVNDEYVDIPDQELLNLVLKKTILNNIVNQFLEKNRLLNFRMRPKRCLRKKRNRGK